MFESLSQRIKGDENKVAARERLIRWVVIILGVAVLLFGGLYVDLRYFQTS